MFFVGIDWAAVEHAVCVLDQAGRKVAAFTVSHIADGFAALARRLGKLSEARRAPVAIERPDGRLVDALLGARHPVMPVKPNAIETWRESEVLSGAKSDPGDAAVIADYLRVRLHRLRPALPYSGRTKASRAVVRTRGDLVDARVAAANQLAAVLDSYWPFGHPEAIAALAGITPVTKASGKQRGVSFRWACNKRLRQALTTFTDNSRHSWAADIDNRARAGGKDRPDATGILARTWVRVIWRCWQDGKPYDPTLHGGAQHFVEQPTAA